LGAAAWEHKHNGLALALVDLGNNTLRVDAPKRVHRVGNVSTHCDVPVAKGSPAEGARIGNVREINVWVALKMMREILGCGIQGRTRLGR
jgi:hypothetical protein